MSQKHLRVKLMTLSEIVKKYVRKWIKQKMKPYANMNSLITHHKNHAGGSLVQGLKSALCAGKERGEYGKYSVSIIDCP